MKTKTNNNGFRIRARIPLCVRQAASQDFRALWRQSSRVVVWSGATVEIRSALSRLQRGGFIDANGLQTAISLLDAMRCGWREVASSYLYAMILD